MTSTEQQSAFNNAEHLRTLEKSLAFERAMTAIEGECTAYDDDWFDLESADFDLSQEVEYLESCHLLMRRPDQPTWVQICDEDEPLFPPVTKPGAANELPALLAATNNTIEDLCRFLKAWNGLTVQVRSQFSSDRSAELNPTTHLPSIEGEHHVE